MADKSCAFCGSTRDLEIDHIDAKQKVSHNIWSWSRSRREAELAKCRVLCRGCHQARSLEQKAELQPRRPMEHGTRATYDTWGCRCDVCLEAERSRHRAKREARRERLAPRDRQEA
jgi:hypothetical protein